MVTQESGKSGVLSLPTGSVYPEPSCHAITIETLLQGLCSNGFTSMAGSMIGLVAKNSNQDLVVMTFEKVRDEYDKVNEDLSFISVDIVA